MKDPRPIPLTRPLALEHLPTETPCLCLCHISHPLNLDPLQAQSAQPIHVVKAGVRYQVIQERVEREREFPNVGLYSGSGFCYFLTSQNLNDIFFLFFFFEEKGA